MQRLRGSWVKRVFISCRYRPLFFALTLPSNGGWLPVAAVARPLKFKLTLYRANDQDGVDSLIR